MAVSAFNHGDRVVKSSPTGSYRGKIFEVIQPEEDYVGMLIACMGQEMAESYVEGFRKRDKDYDKFPIYIVEPDGNGEPVKDMTQAESIIPGITKKQFKFLCSLTQDQTFMFFFQRLFIALDSDLLPDDPELSKK